HLGQDAEEPHPRAGGRSGECRDDTLRFEQGPDHLPLQVTAPTLVLASASPRRLALLAQIGIVPGRVISTDIDESARSDELPRHYVRRLARAKAAAVDVGDAYVLAADTVVALGRRILPKTETEDDAQRCLIMLSGRRHRVLTSV